MSWGENMFKNIAEEFYALSMIITTILSVPFMDESLKNGYSYFYVIGENLALLINDIIGYSP